MSAYSKFKKCIGVAMGKKEAQAMKNAVDSGDDTGGADAGFLRRETALATTTTTAWTSTL